MRALVVFAVLVFSGASPAKETSEIRFSPHKLDELPRLGTGNITDTISVRFGEMFVGQTKVGVVTLRNPTKARIKIKDVTSSCGCTAIYPSRKEIEPSEELDVVVRLQAKSAGKIRSSIAIRTDGHTGIIKVAANGIVPLEILDPNVTARDGACRFSVRINDDRLDPKLLVAFINGKKCKQVRVDEGTADFEYECGSKSYAVVIPRYNSEVDFGPQRLNIAHPGDYRLITRSVFSKSTKEGHEFRLLLLGDHGIAESTTAAQIEVGDQTFDAEVECNQLGKIFHVDVSLADAALGTAVMRLDGKELTFELRGVQ